MSSILILSPDSFCSQMNFDSLVPFWCWCRILPRCSFHLSMNVLPVIPMYDFVIRLVFTSALYTTLLVEHWPLTGHTLIFLSLSHLHFCSELGFFDTMTAVCLLVHRPLTLRLFLLSMT